MRTMFTGFLLALLPGLLRPQPNDPPPPLAILLIGASHHYSYPQVERFSYPLNKAIAFKPDAVFGEDLAPQDYEALDDFWNKAALEKRVAYVRSHTNLDPSDPNPFIQQAYRWLRQRPHDHQQRMKLARALYLGHDFGNARYQLYLLDQRKPTFSAQDRKAYRAILGEPDSLYRSRSSEYHNIFFPLLDKLKQDRILPMDSQQYDLLWQAAWNSLSDKLERAVAAEKDTNSANYRVWTSFLEWQQTFRSAEDQIQQAGQTTRNSNTDLYSARVDSVNFGGDRLLQNLNGFPAAEAAQMRHYWQLRNEAMCQNIVNRARAIKARRVVVGVGSAHRKTMIDILRAMPNVKVYTLNEYQPERPAEK